MLKSIFLYLLLICFSQQSHAACGANTRTWQADAGTTNWNSNNNWNPRNRPNNSSENALIISDWFNPTYPGNNYTLGCFEIQSGTMSALNNNRLTLVGDYFRNLNTGSIILGATNTWEVRMQGTSPQTFENVDTIPRLRLNNPTSINLTESFAVRNLFTIISGTGSIFIEKDLETQQTTAVSIPSGTSITLLSGSSWTLNGNLNVNGSLIMEPGSRLIFNNSASLNINTGAIIDINGTSGNSVQISGSSPSSRMGFNILGSLDAQFLLIENLNLLGLNVTGSVTRFDSITINSIPSNGSGITLSSSGNFPSSLNEVGFFSDNSAGPFTNINASTYNSDVINFINWLGIGNSTFETDPNNKINWGTEALPVLQVLNSSPSGIPSATISKGSPLSHFATFSFSMTGAAATSTNVTSLTFTLDGVNANSDISNIAVYNDDNSNCTFDSGTDSLIGNYSPSGSPGTINVSLSGEINIIDTNEDCLHIFIATSASASTDNTIGISIESSDHVLNDQNYELSSTASPPVRPGTSTITGSPVRRWNGGYGTNMFTGNNWTPSGVPNNNIDCEIGNGYTAPNMSGNFNCLNTKFQNSGSINWNNRSDFFNIYGAWIVENGFSYNNANNANIRLQGNTNQSVFLNNTTFPSNLTINSSGNVIFENSGTIGGDINLSSGNIIIAPGTSLQVNGNITISASTTFTIQPGGELILGNGSTLTVNSSGTLSLVGSISQNVNLRAVNDSSSYLVNINNGATIRAQYYSFRNLGTTGLTINSTSVIDPTYHLQNGSFTFPGSSSSTQLRLFRQIPGDNLDGMTFDSSSSPATSTNSILTNTSTTGDVLSMTNYTGNLTGPAYTSDTNYLVSWDSETNEIKVTQESLAPLSSIQGEVVNMGSFGFQQLNAGPFNNTELTLIRITLIGTGSSSDVDSASLYYDSTCSGSGGVLIGTQNFSGSPARAIFSNLTGVIVESHATNPPLRCINVEFNLNSLASDGKTIGAEISTNLHIENSEGYSFNGSFAPPVNLGTTTINGNTTQWTGAVSTNWFTAGNWNGGVPNANINCIINNQPNDPVISSGTASCKSVSIGDGTLTHNGGTLEIYGSLESTGTLNSNSDIIFRDNGITPTSQNIDVTSPLSDLRFNKTAGGLITINNDLVLSSNLNIVSGQNFTLTLSAYNSLTLLSGLTLTSAVFNMEPSSQIKIGPSQSILINGGTFQTTGTNDPYPQTLFTKAHITNTGGNNTWSFNATSGNVDLIGFYFDWLDDNGLQISGTSNLINLSGGQLRNLSTSPTMKALQFNTSGSIPITSSNFGWNWGPDNSPPSEVSPYLLGYSNGCSMQTIDFDQWFGDFWPLTTVTSADKVSATNCTILIDPAKSPVSLTKLTAIAYDTKVLIEWTTGNEWNHRGFNIYRSTSENDSFVQINSEEIMNDLFSSNIHGSYAFIDHGVKNDQTYYYLLEDISTKGEKTLHGPLSATPKMEFGELPLIQAGTIISSSDLKDSNNNDEMTNIGSGFELLENVWLLSETANFLRFKIIVPELSFSDDPLNNHYKKLFIEGYSATTKTGEPELLNKTILIPIEKSFENFFHEDLETQETVFDNISVTPSPNYIVNEDTIVPQWEMNEDAYSFNKSIPESPIRLSKPIKLDNKYFLPLTIQAIQYNAVTKTLVKLDELLFNVYLSNEKPWDSVSPDLSPWMREGSIKIGLTNEGMYQLTYDDLYNAGVVTSIDKKPIEGLHLKIRNTRIGIDVISDDNYFNRGDKILFYAPSLRSDEDINTYAVLYYEDNDTNSISKKIDSTTFNFPASQRPGFWTKKVYEQNNIAIFNEPYTEETDHFVWKLIYGVAGGEKSPLEVDIDLPYLSLNGNVSIRTLVKGRKSNSANTKHHIEVYINDNETPAADFSFQAVETKSLLFNIPASYFVQGKNKIKLVASGKNLIPGEYDMLYIDRLETYFHQNWVTNKDEALLLDQPALYNYSINGYSNPNIYIYDVSNPSKLYSFANANIDETDIGYKVTFPISDASDGRRVWVGTYEKLKKVKSLKMISGSYLSDSNNQADIAFIGHKDLLEAVQPLGNFRESQGYKVKYVVLENIYNEFEDGLANTIAIKKFIQAAAEWKIPPSYFILLGDGTYDPKGFQNPIMKYRFPVKFISGSSFDYASDHWYVADQSGSPDAVIARIPATSVNQLNLYTQKVLEYESGLKKPDANSSIRLISDKAHYLGENFESPIEELKAQLELDNILNKKDHIKRSNLSDEQLQKVLIEGFSSSSIIHYMGHGAENIWADQNVFSNQEAINLQNNTLPIVIAMNCLNAQYSFPEISSLSEKLIFNPNGGAIAFWGSTSFTPPSIQDIYQKIFYKNLSLYPEKSIGEIIKLTKVQGNLSSPYKELNYSWTIIGDPLLKPALNHKKTENRQPTQTQELTDQTITNAARGCSAVASEQSRQAQTPWSLIFSLFLESMLCLICLRIFMPLNRKF